MRDTYDECRREAAYCEAMAQKAPNEELRAHWLRLAGRWLAMIPQVHRPTPEEKFDIMVQIRGTGQKQSKSTH